MNPLSQQNRIPILIVGIDSQLGNLIAQHCLKQSNLLVNVLVSDITQNKDICESVNSQGGKCLIGDIKNYDSIKGCCKDIHTVISTVSTDESTMISGQNALLKDAIENNVVRFVPSDFTFDYRYIKEEEHPSIAKKIIFRKQLMSSPIKGIFIHCGIFYETFFENHTHGISYYETIDQKFALTSMDDIARITAAAIAIPDKTGDIAIAGDQLSIREIIEIYDELRDVKISCKKLGNLADLYKAIGIAKEKGEIHKSHLLNYQVFVIDGRGAMKELNNEDFPDIKLIHLDKYILTHPEKKLGENVPVLMAHKSI